MDESVLCVQGTCSLRTTMTSIVSKICNRVPLKDQTNVFNMNKGERVGKNKCVLSEVNPIATVKLRKSSRDVKTNTKFKCSCIHDKVGRKKLVHAGRKHDSPKSLRFVLKDGSSTSGDTNRISRKQFDNVALPEAGSIFNSIEQNVNYREHNENNLMLRQRSKSLSNLQNCQTTTTKHGMKKVIVRLEQLDLENVRQRMRSKSTSELINKEKCISNSLKVVLKDEQLMFRKRSKSLSSFKNSQATITNYIDTNNVTVGVEWIDLNVQQKKRSKSTSELISKKESIGKSLKVVLTDILKPNIRTNETPKKYLKVVLAKESLLQYQPARLDNKEEKKTRIRKPNPKFNEKEYEVYGIKLNMPKNTNSQDNESLKTTPNIHSNSSDIVQKPNVKIDMQVKQSKGILKPTLRTHNLRKGVPKNYIDESFIDSLIVKAKDMTNEKQKDNVPIYRKQLPAEHTKMSADDLYEFVDTSPKVKKTKSKRRGKSSILFDKDTHEIMKKLEENEVKAKTKITRKKNVKQKSYKNIVADIVSNIQHKIKHKNNIVQPSNIQEEIRINTSVVPVNDSCSYTQLKPSHPQSLQGISNVNLTSSHAVNSCDTSVLQSDIDNCFGFEEAPIVSTPINKNPINVLSSVIVKPANDTNESPIDFNSRRPNANSTMVQRTLSSPWRTDWINVRGTRRYVSLKNNALPRINQDQILDHNLVDSLESAVMRTPRLDEEEIPKKKVAVQQSILDFVESNVEKENPVVERSLFDYEEFSPVKRRQHLNSSKKLGEVKRNLLQSEVVASTPMKRQPLMDISNSSENFTFFGFGDGDVTSSEKNMNVNDDLDAKPIRFDIDQLKSYTKKGKKQKKNETNISAVAENQDRFNSISLVQMSQEGDQSNEFHLFEEPEEMLDNMSPVETGGKKHRRKRLNSWASDESDHEKKKKHHKKSKQEIEQEIWIRDFNQMCDEIDKEELIVE